MNWDIRRFADGGFVVPTEKDWYWIVYLPLRRVMKWGHRRDWFGIGYWRQRDVSAVHNRSTQEKAMIFAYTYLYKKRLRIQPNTTLLDYLCTLKITSHKMYSGDDWKSGFTSWGGEAEFRGSKTELVLKGSRDWVSSFKWTWPPEFEVWVLA